MPRPRTGGSRPRRRQGERVNDMTDEQSAHGELRCSRPTADTLRVEVVGDWHLHDDLPSAAVLQPHLEAPGVQRLTFETQALGRWDSGLVTVLLDVLALGAQRRLVVDQDGLPSGLRRLLHLATAVPERQGARREAIREPFLDRIGRATLGLLASAGDLLGFIGEALLALVKLLRGQARFRPVELWLLIQACGAQALPIVTLICFLVGAILAFIGSVQLAMFGAQIYVANLVAMAMALEMGAMMTAIIMAGRTGAAFAAQLGTMTVNEEIDALTTLGLSPMEFLVVPRMLALVTMMPLLTLYADLLGILGGGLIGVAVLGMSPVEYFQQTRGALTLGACAQGLIKGGVYGLLVALAGCLRGMQCGRSAAAVGQATTSAVVTSIVCIITASAILTVIFFRVW
jgi:phospholipid/cholesterol/gamma-HCH transport system permease protein